MINMVIGLILLVRKTLDKIISKLKNKLRIKDCYLQQKLRILNNLIIII